jgi:hypothetical protein
MTVISHFIKDPQAVIDYTIRWTGWLGDDTIASSSWIVPAGIVNTSESNNTVDTIIWVASGTVGQVYEIINRIITAGGQQNDQTISILIREK